MTITNTFRLSNCPLLRGYIPQNAILNFMNRIPIQNSAIHMAYNYIIKPLAIQIRIPCNNTNLNFIYMPLTPLCVSSCPHSVEMFKDYLA